MERSLARLRARKNWTQEQAAGFVGVDVGTYRKWEHGTVIPRPSSIHLLCEAFEVSSSDLGFQSIGSSQVSAPPASPDLADVAQFFLASDPTMRLLSLAFLPLDSHTMQREVIKLLEEQNMQRDPISRREALRRLATLPIATLHLNAVTPTVTAPAQEVLAHCSAGIVACWYLRKGKELSFADSAVSAYLPTLKELVTTSSSHRKAAADLLVQCYLLKTALSWSITSPINGIGYAQQAETYSKVAEKPLLQVASLRAQAAVFCYAYQWEQALQAGLQAKQIMETAPKELIPPLALSYVYAGLATYQAYHGQKQDALTSLKKAHTTFFAQTEDDAASLYIDHDIGNLLINDGLTHTHLSLYKSAVDSFAQIDAQIEQHSIDTVFSFRGRAEAHIDHVIAEISRDDQGRDMDKCIALWIQGITEAKSIQSNKHYADALAAYTAMKAVWPGEERIKQLREHTTHW